MLLRILILPYFALNRPTNIISYNSDDKIVICTKILPSLKPINIQKKIYEKLKYESN